MEVSYSIQYFSSKEYIFDIFRNFSLQVLHLNKKINNKIFFIYKQVLLTTSNIIYIHFSFLQLDYHKYKKLK